MAGVDGFLKAHGMSLALVNNTEKVLWDALGSFTEWNFPDVGGESSASNDLGGVEMYIATLGVAIL